MTGFGLKLDRDLCGSLVRELVRDADVRERFVRIDMEDSSTTDETLALYRELRAEGHERVGIVLQAALRRTLADIDSLAELRPGVRLCKGIYVEPPSIAYQEFDAIRRSFVDALDALLDARLPARDRDARRVAHRAVARAGRRARPAAYEFQMLLGVRTDRARELVAAGHPLRMYVPYGQQWYEYSLRRLQENPKVAGYVARDVAGRLVSRAGRRGFRRLRPWDEDA